MFLSSKLKYMLQQEIDAGNVIEGEYLNQFANCKILVILRKPFKVTHAVSDGVLGFVNRDSHYPLGRGYKDSQYQEILLAPQG